MQLDWLTNLMTEWLFQEKCGRKDWVRRGERMLKIGHVGIDTQIKLISLKKNSKFIM